MGADFRVPQQRRRASTAKLTKSAVSEVARTKAQKKSPLMGPKERSFFRALWKPAPRASERLSPSNHLTTDRSAGGWRGLLVAV